MILAERAHLHLQHAAAESHPISGIPWNVLDSGSRTIFPQESCSRADHRAREVEQLRADSSTPTPPAIAHHRSHSPGTVVHRLQLECSGSSRPADRRSRRPGATTCSPGWRRRRRRARRARQRSLHRRGGPAGDLQTRRERARICRVRVRRRVPALPRARPTFASDLEERSPEKGHPLLVKLPFGVLSSAHVAATVLSLSRQ